MRGANVRGLRIGAVLMLLLLSACASTHPVKCDAHLVPINAPHPKVVPGSAP